MLEATSTSTDVFEKRVNLDGNLCEERVRSARSHWCATADTAGYLQSPCRDLALEVLYEGVAEALSSPRFQARTAVVAFSQRCHLQR